jgi:acetolactate synthase-1/2/3 large subunit
MRDLIGRELREYWPNELRTFEAMRSVLPRDAIMVGDPTVAVSRASRCFDVYQPRTFMYPHGWAGLGFGFPASLGAKLAKPESPVVCVTGDGGFQYNMQGLATAAQYDINPVVVMFNDDAWGVLKDRQVQNFKGRVIGTDLVNPDFVKLVESYGFQGTKVSTLDSALSSGRLQFIEAQIPNGFGAFQ